MSDGAADRGRKVAIILLLIAAGGVVVTGHVGAANGTSDIRWSTDDTVRVYDIDDQDVRSIDPVTLTQSGEFVTLLQSDHQGGHPWGPWLDAYDTNLGFYAEVGETNLENGDADTVDTRYGIVTNDLSPAYVDSVGFTSRFVEFGDPLRDSKTDLNPRVYMSGNYIYYGVRLENAEFGGFLGDNDRTTIRNIRVVESHEDQNTAETYSFDVSSRQAQSTTGEATLSFDHEAVSQGDAESNPLQIDVNGRTVYSDTPVSGDVITTSFDPSVLTEGDNTVRIYVNEATGTDASHDDYGYEITDVALDVPTDGDYDDDNLYNWEEDRRGADPNDADTDTDGLDDGPEVKQYGTDPTTDDTDGDGLADRQEVNGPTDPTTADTDGDGVDDGADDAPTKPEDQDGFQDRDGVPDPDNDGDGIPDSEDDAPNEPEDIDNCKDADGAPDPEGACTSDSDGDGILDSEDGAPNEPEDRDGYQDGDGIPDPDNDGDGIPDSEDGAPNEPEDQDGYQDADGVPDPDNDGSGGGGGPSEGPNATQIELIDSNSGVTARVQENLTGQDVTIATNETVTGEGVALSSLSIAHQSTPDGYRVEISDVSDSVPGGTPTVKAGDAVGYLDITPVGADSIDTAELSFTLSESALPAGASADDVVIYHYDGSWETLETQHVGTSGNTHEFMAVTDGFSPFAVGVQSGETAVVDATLTPAEVGAGEPTTVTAAISNDGYSETQATVGLRINGEFVTERDVSVAGGETVETTFEVSIEERGAYTVSVNDVDAGTLYISDGAGANATDGNSTTSGTESEGDTAAPNGSDSDPAATDESEGDTTATDEGDSDPATTDESEGDTASTDETGDVDISAEVPGFGVLTALLATLLSALLARRR